MKPEETDEGFAWKTALAIMGFLSFLTGFLRILTVLGFSNYSFFTPEFEISLLYIPTIVLLIGWGARKRSVM